MLKFLVVKPKGNASVLQIVPEESEINGQFESWALNDGKQILFVDTQMHKVLKSFHMFGNYESGAMYGYSFDEMVKILTSKLGLCDRARFMELEQAQNGVRYVDQSERWEWRSQFVIEAFWFMIKFLVMAGKFLAWMVLIPLLIRLFSKHK